MLQLYTETKLLWEFINSLLDNPAYREYVCWEDRDNWTFRIVNPAGLAQLWGSEKRKSSMNYEKLSRALRYYYRMNIIAKVQGRRLTYRFVSFTGETYILHVRLPIQTTYYTVTFVLYPLEDFKRNFTLCRGRYLKPPSCIQKGQRGAKPGVPHKRRADRMKDGKPNVKQKTVKSKTLETTSEADNSSKTSAVVASATCTLENGLGIEAMSETNNHCATVSHNTLLTHCLPETVQSLTTSASVQSCLTPRAEDSSDSEQTLDLRINRT